MYTYDDICPINERFIKGAVTNRVTRHVQWWGCPVPGCETRTAEAGACIKHANKTHVVCRCGWVGVSLGHHIGHNMSVICGPAGEVTVDPTWPAPWHIYFPPNIRAHALLEEVTT